MRASERRSMLTPPFRPVPSGLDLIRHRPSSGASDTRDFSRFLRSGREVADEEAVEVLLDELTRTGKRPFPRGEEKERGGPPLPDVADGAIDLPVPEVVVLPLVGM